MPTGLPFDGKPTTLKIQSNMSEDQTGRNKDRLFNSKEAVGDFVFDERVASVFEDMISRSVPGYATILNMLGVLTARYVQPGSKLFDLGCSLGGSAFAMAGAVNVPGCEIIAVDNSAAMIERLERRLQQARDQGSPALGCPVQCRLEDIQQSPIDNASVVVLNFTLQFIPRQQRSELLQRVYDGMRPGAMLLISEKILFPDADLNELFIDMYHAFKERMGYSKLEISQKRAALENVLIPETLDDHRQRLAACGFSATDCWFQCFNFASMVAFKQS
jgi:tRNA (cmo5U34)-methyltransferase